MKPYEFVVIGVSAGGMMALKTILPHLPEDFPMAMAIVQHIHSRSDGFMAYYLSERCQLSVSIPDDKEPIKTGHIYLAPPNYHLLVEEDRTFSLSTDLAVNFARPSIDVLFETAAEVYQNKLIGIILTGANTDGSRGLKAIKDAGGLTIVQDPDSAEVAAMPRAALELTDVDHVLPLEMIGPFLTLLARKMKYE